MAYIVGSFYNASTFSKRKGRIIRGAFKSYSSNFNDSGGKSHIGYTLFTLRPGLTSLLFVCVYTAPTGYFINHARCWDPMYACAFRGTVISVSYVGHNFQTAKLLQLFPSYLCDRTPSLSAMESRDMK